MTTSATLSELERLRQLYQAGFQNNFLDNAVHKIMKRQIVRDEEDLARVNEELAAFERQYGMTSERFWEQYQAGELGDAADFVEWNAFCKMQNRIKSRLQILRGNAAVKTMP